ncbi:MAG: pyridoxamine kinase [Deltaproteobacteria bacterium]|jgi:pyridoxine kinase|nr:pyridoxamine kinase [Deltaproteobacteria bacterium]
MKNPLARVAAIHDLSGFGRCSLTVVIPILSTMGIEVCPVPTAILSAHTAIEGYTLLDLTEELPSFIDHWRKLGLRFDAIYSGFLGSVRQADIVADFIDSFKTEDTLVVLDPVMADYGKLYPSMPQEMVGEMKKLATRAQVITPNITEAAFLLDRSVPEFLEEEEVKDWLRALSDLGPSMPVITSLPLKSRLDLSTVAAYNREDGRFWVTGRPYVPTQYHGTGDIFSSVLTGSLLQGDSLPSAMDRASQFVAAAIRGTFGYSGLPHHEILLERTLKNLNVANHSDNYDLLP